MKIYTLPSSPSHVRDDNAGLDLFHGYI
uniref:Uncharacterized protein n=1 Tax=Rhizophora mucronata TaxID=61149 RepID=A0A2P2Q4B5_RHIMU